MAPCSDGEAIENLFSQALHGGLFVVSGGELESWLKSLGVKGHGSDDISSAQNVEEYRRNADLVLGKLRLFVVEVENAEPVSVRREKAVFEEEIEDMIARAQDNPNAIIYGTFHTWDRDTS